MRPGPFFAAYFGWLRPSPVEEGLKQQRPLQRKGTHCFNGHSTASSKSALRFAAPSRSRRGLTLHSALFGRLNTRPDARLLWANGIEYLAAWNLEACIFPSCCLPSSYCRDTEHGIASSRLCLGGA